MLLGNSTPFQNGTTDEVKQRANQTKWHAPPPKSDISRQIVTEPNSVLSLQIIPEICNTVSPNARIVLVDMTTSSAATRTDNWLPWLLSSWNRNVDVVCLATNPRVWCPWVDAAKDILRGLVPTSSLKVLLFLLSLDAMAVPWFQARAEISLLVIIYEDEESVISLIQGAQALLQSGLVHYLVIRNSNSGTTARRETPITCLACQRITNDNIKHGENQSPLEESISAVSSPSSPSFEEHMEDIWWNCLRQHGNHITTNTNTQKQSEAVVA